MITASAQCVENKTNPGTKFMRCFLLFLSADTFVHIYLETLIRVYNVKLQTDRYVYERRGSRVLEQTNNLHFDPFLDRRTEKWLTDGYRS